MESRVVSNPFVALVLLFAALPAYGAEPGSGYYARDCDYPDPEYAINIGTDGTAQVSVAGVEFDRVLTTYSFYGNGTPPDFLVALQFKGERIPLQGPNGHDGWFEIWKDENAFYILENGDEALRLNYCADLS